MQLRVRELREEKGWNQTVLGYHAGLSPSQISQIETGKRNPTVETLQGIATALGVGVGDLFPKVPAPLPEVLGEEEWRRRLSRIMGLHMLAAKLRMQWEEELKNGRVGNERASEICFAIGGIVHSAFSETLLGGIEKTDRADAKQVKSLRKTLDQLFLLHRHVIDIHMTDLQFQELTQEITAPAEIDVSAHA